MWRIKSRTKSQWYYQITQRKRETEREDPSVHEYVINKLTSFSLTGSMAPYIPISKAYTLRLRGQPLFQYRSPHPITCHPASAQVFSVTRILSHKSSHLFWKIPLEGASNILSQRCLSVDSHSPLRLCRTNVCQLHEDGDSNYGASSATSFQVLFPTQISKFLAISHMTSLLECDSQNQPKSCE